MTVGEGRLISLTPEIPSLIFCCFDMGDTKRKIFNDYFQQFDKITFILSNIIKIYSKPDAMFLRFSSTTRGSIIHNFKNTTLWYF